MATANYFIPPELRKHVQLIKELPEIVADTVTDPDTGLMWKERIPAPLPLRSYSGEGWGP